MRSARDQDSTRDVIMRSARQLFARRGYAATSMRTIAESSGVTKATIYHHFPDKAALFREVLGQALEQIRQSIEREVASAQGPLERVRALAWAHLRTFVEQRDLVRQIYVMIFLPEEASVSVSDIFHKQSCGFRTALADCSAAGYLPPDEVEDAALVLVGALEYAGALSLLDPAAARPTRGLAHRILERVLPWTASSRPLNRLASLLLPLLIAGSLSLDLAQARTVEAIAGSSVPIPLETCIAEALAHNSTVLAAREGRTELSGQKKQAVAIGLPTLDASGTWSRGRDPSFALDQTFGGGSGGQVDSSATGLDSLLAGFSFLPAPEDIAAQTFWRTSLNVGWELQPSLIYNAVGAASLGIRRQEALIADTEHRTVEAITRAYHAVVMAGELLAAVEDDITAKREFLDITRQRLELGFSTPLDTLRAAVAHANLLPQRRNVAQQLRDAGSHLNVLMGREPQAPLRLQAQEVMELDPIDPELAVKALPRRPDLVGIDLMTRILGKNRGAIKAAHRPVLSANASYGYVTGELGDMFDTGHDFWSASITLRVPLFDGLRTMGRVQEAQAQLRRTELEWIDAARRARLELFSLLGELEAARANYHAAQLNAAAAQDALAQIQMRYELGQADYLSVLDVQAGRSLAQSNLISARHEVLSVTASLKRAMGFRPDSTLAQIHDRLRQEAS